MENLMRLADSMVVRFAFVVLVRAVDLVVFDPEEGRVQLGCDAANQLN